MNTLPGITAETITTERLTTRVLLAGDASGTPVLFIHGNASSATYWEQAMLDLPSGFRGIAHDQRGYGDAEPDKKIDATRGVGDLADDAIALLDHLNIEKTHLVGHSMGGSVIWRLMMDYPDRILTVTLAAPGSPFGFGGCKPDGTPWFADGAGSGGGTGNPEFVKLIEANDRGEDAQNSPRNVMNAFYWKPPFRAEREEDLLSSLLSTHTGDQDYPGDATASENWPTFAPGKFGVLNALAPTYADDIQKLYDISPKPPVLWIRGADDQIVSDNSMFDLGALGKLGVIPGYPGEDVCPPQPMIQQTRDVLEKYQAAGGQYQEVVFEETGHTPYIEKPAEFNAAFHAHISA